MAEVKLGKLADPTDAHIALPPRSSKKRRGRRLQLHHPEVAAWLAKHGKLDKRFGSEPLFINERSEEDEKRWAATCERRVLAKAYKAAGVTHIKPNELGRHFFATHAVNSGADAYAVKNWLGHTDIATTERYANARVFK